jgi:acetyl esterase
MSRLHFRFQLLAHIAAFMLPSTAQQGPARARRRFLKSSQGPRWLHGKKPPLSFIKDDTLAGIRVRRYLPINAKPGVVAFFHGGGWVIGEIAAYETLAASLAAATGHEVVSVEYRLAPEHRYPAALDDCLAVTAALLKTSTVAVAGDSAGGNLAAAVANRLPVRAQLLLYPVVDCANEANSYERYATGHVLTRHEMRYFRDAYLPDAHSRHDSGASPLLASSLKGAPPTYLMVAQCDVLRDEGVAYAARLRSDDVDVVMDEVPGTLHGFMSLLGLREAQAGLARASTWLQGQFTQAAR